MTLRRKPASQVLAEIREWFASGQVDAATERLESLVERAPDDAALLRDAVMLACEAIRGMPRPKKKGGRPANPPRPSVRHGVVDVSAMTPMTAAEKRRMAKAIASDYAIAEEVDSLRDRMTLEGAEREVARNRKSSESVVRKAYHRVTPSRKP